MLIPLQDLIKKYNFHPKGVVHIGANEGQEAEAYFKTDSINKVMWFEALPLVFEKLKDHIKKTPRIEHSAFKVLLSDEDDVEVDFNIANNDGQSSSMLEFGTHTKMHPTVKFTDKVKLKTKRFDTFMDSQKGAWEEELWHPDYDFLNVDVQGAELKVLEGMGDYLNQFKWLYLEVNRSELYLGCPMVEELDEYVKPYGFTRVETKWTGAGWGDGFYIKK